MLDQIRWERDVALQTLHDLGYELGIKAEIIKKEISEAAIEDFARWEERNCIDYCDNWEDVVAKYKGEKNG